MIIAEIRNELIRIYQRLVDTPAGAHWSSLYNEFNTQHPAARWDLGAELFDDMLKNKSLQVMSDTDRRSSKRQLHLPGIDVEFDATVTIPDGEGSFRRKRVERATAEELIADEAIHTENVESAVSALDRATQRNQLLLPVMEQQNFHTAGEAIEYLVSDS